MRLTRCYLALGEAPRPQVVDQAVVELTAVSSWGLRGSPWSAQLGHVQHVFRRRRALFAPSTARSMRLLTFSLVLEPSTR